jgi:hypothetical protein
MNDAVFLRRRVLVLFMTDRWGSFFGKYFNAEEERGPLRTQRRQVWRFARGGLRDATRWHGYAVRGGHLAPAFLDGRGR